MAPPPAPELHIRRVDRWSLRWRMWRAAQLGARERRASLLRAAWGAGVGAPVAGVDQRPSGGLTHAALRLVGGQTITLGRCHRPTLVRLSAALVAGPVVIEHIADHRHCWGLYLRTALGPLAVLAPHVVVGTSTGGIGAAHQLSSA